MAVDDALAAVFRTRFALKHHRKLKKGYFCVCYKDYFVYCLASVDEAKSVLHFKLRVLDLVELYIRKESTNPLVLVGHMTTHLHITTLPLPLPNFRTWWSPCTNWSILLRVKRSLLTWSREPLVSSRIVSATWKRSVYYYMCRTIKTMHSNNKRQ